MEPDEGSTPFGPARKASSSPTAAAQQLLAEVGALAQHQRVVEAAPHGDGALQITHLWAQGQPGSLNWGGRWGMLGRRRGTERLRTGGHLDGVGWKVAVQKREPVTLPALTDWPCSAPPMVGVGELLALVPHLCSPS